MKSIAKGDEPVSFHDWKQQNRTANWDDFSGSDIYQELKKILIEQQKKICCYCEIALQQSTDAHVEHLKDKGRYPQETFNFYNLLASCQHNDSCGHKKGKAYFDDMVSPLDADCQSYFTYTGNGKIIPSDENDTFAQQTIELLGLNCKRLQDRRKSIIKTLDSSDSNYLQQSLNNCVDWYGGFFTVIQYLIEKSQ